jgi:hypothetical protein
MEVITKEQLEQVREAIAKSQGMPLAENVRCLYCSSWGWNRGKVMNSVGESSCKHRKRPDNKTASYQWCKKFEHYC